MITPLSDISRRHSAVIAGYGYLFIIVLAIFAEFFVRSKLVIPEDAATTAGNISSNQGLFRLGIVGYLLAAIFDVVVALGLYVFLKPINKSLSLLAAWLRFMHATIFALALGNLLNVLQLLSGAKYLSAFSAGQLQAQVMLSLDAFDYEWRIGLVFFGLHCLVLGYLIVRSGYIPKLLGVVLIIAAFGYIIDSFAYFLMTNYTAHEDLFLAIVALPALVAEVSLCLWLLSRGMKVGQV